MAGPTTITVDWAAYGTEANGASAKLLGAPARGISEAEARSLRLRFERVRLQLKVMTEPAWAFVPVTDARWALLRLDPHGPGGRGEVGVLWAALLDVPTLAAIDWAVPDLLATALPSPGLPPPGQVYSPHRVAVPPAAPQPAMALGRACDQVAGAIPAAPCLLLLPAGWAPVASLSALWSRLLPEWRAARSFTSWHQLAEDADVILARPAEMDAALPTVLSARPRLALDAQAPPLPLVDEFLRALHGLTFPPRTDSAEATAAAAAQLLGHLATAAPADGKRPVDYLGNWQGIRHLANYRLLLDLAMVACLETGMAGAAPPQRLVPDLERLLGRRPADADLAPGLLHRLAQMIVTADQVPSLPEALRDRLAPALLADDAALLRQRPGQLQALQAQWDWWLPRLLKWLDARWLALAGSWSATAAVRDDAAVRLAGFADWPAALPDASGPQAGALMKGLAGELRYRPPPGPAGSASAYLVLRQRARRLAERRADGGEDARQVEGGTKG